MSNNKNLNKRIPNTDNFIFKQKKNNLIMILGLIVFLFFIYFYMIPNNVSSSLQTNYGLTDDFIPKLSTAIMFLAAIIYLIIILVNPQSTEVFKTVKKFSKPRMLKELLVILWSAFYFFVLVDQIGFYVSTLLFLIGSFYFLGERRIFLILSTVFLLTISLFIIFEKLFNIFLPKGTIF